MHFFFVIRILPYINALHLVINSGEVVYINNENESMMFALNKKKRIVFQSYTEFLENEWM